jgi:hypothetical protein
MGTHGVTETLDAEAGEFNNINIFHLFADDSARYSFSFLYAPHSSMQDRAPIAKKQ